MDVNNIESVEDALKLLQTWREDVVRCSEDVIGIWEIFLSEPQIDMGEERWMVLEQVAVAAMDTDRKDIVTSCIQELRNEFGPTSFRVRRLDAMRAEMLEKWDLAHDILDQMLEEDSSNSQVRKRKIAIHRARGEHTTAINELNKYLEDFMSDGEACMELCELYILQQDYLKAGFCCEELILQNPHNHLYYQKFAEIKYTEGGFENLVLAKNYYCHALKVNPINMRALYGLVLTLSQLVSSSKIRAEEKSRYMKLHEWASNQILNRYNLVLGEEEINDGSNKLGNEIEIIQKSLSIK